MIKNSTNKNNFRYDINALRAIAVLGVVFFHFKVPYFSGGFSGVDIFFVISGYLMSRIIISGINKNSFSLADFYGKRVKRIIPALLVLITVVTAICFFIYFPSDYKTNEKNAASSILFLSNIFYWQNSNYFDPASDTNLFLHTWSLSVEWQFYMLYPLALILLSRFVKNKLSYIIIFTLLTIVLFFFSVIATGHSSTASFYLLPTRAWEMVLGGVAYLSEDYFKNIKRINLLAISSYIALIAGIVFLNERMPWPGFYTLLPTVGTFFIIITNAKTNFIINNTVIQFTGHISYSIYLWHWPVFVISQYMGVPLSAISILLLIATSTGLGYLSYRFVESINFNLNKPILMAAGLLFLITLSFSFTSANRFIFKTEALQLSEYKSKNKENRKEQFSESTCFMNFAGKKNTEFTFDKLQCITIDTSLNNIVLIGDSHAAQFSQSFREKLKARSVKILQATSSGCLPLIEKNGDPKAYNLIENIYRDFLVKNAKKIDGVIISGNWIRLRDDKVELLQQLTKTVKYIESLGIKVVILGQNEVYKIPFPTVLAKEFQFNIKLSSKFLSNDAYEVNEFLKKSINKYYLDIYNINPSQHLSSINTPYMFDENHFTKYGADIIVDKVIANSQFKSFLLKAN